MEYYVATKRNKFLLDIVESHQHIYWKPDNTHTHTHTHTHRTDTLTDTEKRLVVARGGG